MPVISFRVTAEVHEALLKLAEARDQTLTKLFQETASHIVERTQPAFGAQSQVNAAPPQYDLRPQQASNLDAIYMPRAPYGSRLKSEKAKKP